MSSSKGGGDSTTVQKADPWSGQQPFLTYGFNQAQNLYNSGGPQFYPNATYVPFSGQTEQALGRMENRSLGSAPEQGLNQYLTNSLQGNYLNSNPYLDAMYGTASKQMTDAFQEGVMPSLNATFGGAGRTGGGAHGLAAGRAAGELGDSLAGLSANIYGGNYQQERDRMQQAAGMVPMSSALDWQNIAAMGNVGQQVEGKAGQVLGDSMNRFNHYQNAPEQNLARYIAAIQGNYGGTTSTEQQANGGGGLTGALGGGLAGAALGGALPSLGSSMGLMLGSAAWPLGIAGALAGAFL
jgi:hypothetical protein